jgi:hypothetical protein
VFALSIGKVKLEKQSSELIRTAVLLIRSLLILREFKKFLIDGLIRRINEPKDECLCWMWPFGIRGFVQAVDIKTEVLACRFVQNHRFRRF